VTTCEFVDSGSCIWTESQGIAPQVALLVAEHEQARASQNVAVTVEPEHPHITRSTQTHSVWLAPRYDKAASTSEFGFIAVGHWEEDGAQMAGTYSASASRRTVTTLPAVSPSPKPFVCDVPSVASVRLQE
jgi:chitinase